MSSVLDGTLGISVNESTFGTAVTETRWFEIQAGSTIDFDPEEKQGSGMRVASIVPRAGRRRAGLGAGTMTIVTELYSKGFGLMWSWCMPTSVSTLVSGTTFQQNHTLVQTTPTGPSRTVQVGVIDSTGTSRAHRFTGATVSKWSLNIPAPDSDDAVTLTVDVDLRRVPDTATALTAPVMPTAPTIYLPRDVSAVTYAGTVTVATTTALASGGTAIVYARNVKIDCDNSLGQRPNLAAYGQPSQGLRSPTITCDLEFPDTTVRDAYYAQTENSFSVTLTTPEILSVGFAQTQIVAPSTKINSGGQPTYADGEVTVMSGVELAVLDGLVAASPLYVSVRTADSAL